MDSWLSNRDQVHPFDKTTFLSDQPGPHLRFMSSFLESQMFASFIDAKVLANYGKSSQAIRVLDARIKLLKYINILFSLLTAIDTLSQVTVCNIYIIF